MANIVKVRDVMTRHVITVGSNDSLESVARLFEEYDYDGIPVIDADDKLIGIITEYDMVVQSSGMHLPTVISLMRNIGVDKADRKRLNEHFDNLRTIKARDVMNSEPLTIEDSVSLDQAAQLFAEHHRVNPLCVVNGNGELVGVLSHYDVIRFFNKHYVHQVLKTSPAYKGMVDRIFLRKTNKRLNSAIDSAYKGVMLVREIRPLVWKAIALAAFLAGIVAATTFIFDVVVNIR